ncbi:DUF2993 domain-containing protein [Streptomyces sp. 7-21]|jgi:hypothetical protein|uniref:LmeA family phospholipid-binding protein n=1 Tax=Streptomyces sp. 7-21 TaxID=2802283 RepID=UPI00191ECB15|nr:DUF2993 domain-containing protein [Streptomyces sp. 7-21]MBL1068548.1 DUF2993 domain-containing protein [Streptomyces sp. 7-21]
MRVLKSKAFRITAVLLVVVIGLLVIADRVAVKVAESEVASQAREEFGLEQDPEVSIRGFPFLTQVLGRHLDEVRLGLEGYQAEVDGQTVTVEDLELEITDTTIGSGYDSAVAARAEGDGVISYQELSRAYGELLEVGGSNLSVTFSYGGDGRLLLALEATVMGHSVDVGDAEGEVVLEGDRVRLQVPDDQLPDVESERIRERLREELNVERTIQNLPDGLSLTSVEPTEAGLLLHVAGSDLSIA